MQEVREKYAETLAHCERVLEMPTSYWKSHPILTFIAQGEGHSLEFKETLNIDTETGEKHGGVLHSTLKTVAAFLNTDGGTLLIGVSDPGEIKGLDRDFRICRHKNRDGFELKLRDLLNSRFDPVPSSAVSVTFEDLPEGTVFRVDVEPKGDVIHLDNKVFIRDGNSTRELGGRALTNWIQGRSSK